MTIKSDRASWQTIAQTFEREYWTGCVPSITPHRTAQARTLSSMIWGNFGFSQDSFSGKVVLDVGAGPTARCSWLDGTFVAIEPLADTYIHMPYEQIWKVPAEQHIQELVDSVDYVVSLNALDHCYDLPLILHNLITYIREGGGAFLSFAVDKGVEEDETHPLVMTHEEASQAITESGFDIIKHSSGRCYPLGDDVWRDSWGGGTAHHWWLEVSS